MQLKEIVSFHDMLAPIDGEPKRVIVHIHEQMGTFWYITWNRSVTFQLWLHKNNQEFVEKEIQTSGTDVDGLEDACKRASQWMENLYEVGLPID